MRDRTLTGASEPKVREGWEESSRQLAQHGLSEEDIEWLEAPLAAETDEDWIW